MNQILNELFLRKSVRMYEDLPIAHDDKELILRAAFEAPTAGNQQLYTILDITDQGLKDTLAVQCDNQPFIATAPLVLIFLADHRRWLDLYRAAGCTPRGPGAGDLLLAVADACIAAQNAVVAAESLGIGSCYIGDILEHVEAIRALLSLPDEVVPAAMLVFGVPTDGQKKRTKPLRFARDYVVHENAYRLIAPEEHEAVFTEREIASGRQGDFAQRVTAFWKRKYESDFSQEMSRSAAIYLQSFTGE